VRGAPVAARPDQVEVGFFIHGEPLRLVFDTAAVPAGERTATVPERPAAATLPGMKRQNQSQTNGPADTLRLVLQTAAVRGCDVERSNDSEMVRQEKAHDAEGESPSRQNMHDYTKT
jgi:hypothetical protein